MLLVVLLLAAGLLVYWDVSLHRVAALADHEGRPAQTPGQDWLLVGSDSREELSDEEQAELATGDVEGRRTDTVMLVHIPDGAGPTTLVSLPRDSYVPIPGQDRNKLNAAYVIGGPELLTQTVEVATGIRIDRYAEIGFSGFAGMVDAVGGVELCLDEPIDDPLAGINLPAGCQELDGPQALGYVRTRATPGADLERVERQQQFLGALVSRTTSPTVLLNPFRSIPFGSDAVRSLTVDESAHLWHLARLGLGMRELTGGNGVTTTVPIGEVDAVNGIGSVVRWDRDDASRLFEALSADQPVPADLIPTRR